MLLTGKYLSSKVIAGHTAAQRNFIRTMLMPDIDRRACALRSMTSLWRQMLREAIVKIVQFLSIYEPPVA